MVDKNFNKFDIHFMIINQNQYTIINLQTTEIYNLKYNFNK